MRSWRVLVLILFVLVTSLNIVQAQVVPPSTAGIGNTCIGINFLEKPNLANPEKSIQLFAGLTKDAKFNGLPIVAITGAFYYPKAGLTAVPPTIVAANRLNWIQTAYDTTNNGFGFVLANNVDPVAYGITFREEDTVLLHDVGTALFPKPIVDNEDIVILRILYDKGNGNEGTGYCQVHGTPVVPEPGTFALLGMGLIPLIGLVRRKWNTT